MVEQTRLSVGVEPCWSIECRVLCQEEMPLHEGSIWWDAQVWYARLMLRCDLPQDLLTWVLVHELYELQSWRTANWFLEVLEQFLPSESTLLGLERRYREARNQGIELLVGAFLGKRRPHHLTCEEHQLHSQANGTQDYALFPFASLEEEEKETVE